MISTIQGVFVNNKKAQDSIYESGLMVFDCLKLSDKYTLDYVEINEQERFIESGYDFYFFNYHPSTMSWVDTGSLRKLGGTVVTMVLEVLPGDPFVMCPEGHFDGYCVLDPSLRINDSRVFVFPRPLEQVNVKSYVDQEVPVIGTFGFATKGKGFQHVVEAVNKEFHEAKVRINIPFGSFVPDSGSYARFLGNLCKEKALPGIEVQVTHDYMSKMELIDWCAENTLNCFLYDRNMPGLAATTDQAIVAGRPLAVSQNDTFRHILSYIQPYPKWSLRDSLQLSVSQVKQMQNDWTPANFAFKFEEVLTRLKISSIATQKERITFEIPVRGNGIYHKIARRIFKYKRLFRLRNIRQLISFKSGKSNEELI